MIFESGEKEALMEAITTLAEVKKRNDFDTLRGRARRVGERISPERGAEYLQHIIEFQFGDGVERPREPWCV